MKRLSKQIAYQAAYGDECFVWDKQAVKEFIESREKITEAAKVQGVYSDEGLYDFFASFKDFKKVSDIKAAQVLGWPVVEYMLDQKASDPFYELDYIEDDGHLMDGRASAVSYGGAILAGEKNMKSADKKYMKEMDQIIAELGWDVLKYMGVGPNRKSQVVIIPSKDMGEMPAKVNEDIVLEVVYKEGKKDYTFGPDWMPTSLAQRKKMKRIHRKLNRSIRERESNIKKLVAIYPGRFQPFGPHHKASYEFLKSRFDEVYIVTSGKTGGARHPMNFAEKKKHMMRMGIPGKAIKMENQPYIPKGLLSKFDENTTAAVFAVGAKDEGRLTSGKYFLPYRQNYNRLKGFKEQGYTLEIPHTSIKVGGMEISGTTMRKLLSSNKFDLKAKKKFFQKMFGYFDQKVFDKFTTSFSEEIKLDVNVGDTILVGRFKNKKIKVKNIGKDKHGMPTINGRKIVNFRKLDENKQQIKTLHKFLTKYTKSAKKASDMINKNYKRVKNQFRGDSTRDLAMALIGYDAIGENKRKPRKKGQHRNSPNHSDLYTDENPKGTIKGLKFATVKDAQASVNKIKSSGKSHAHKIQAAVAMEQRAKEMGKKSAAAVYRSFINKMKEKTKRKNESKEKELLLMGGAYGHMAHPFDDYALTFGELKDIIDLGLQGKLNKEEAVTEKLDGQNIMISVINGKAKAARNKGDLKSGGMNLRAVKAKFKNHIPSVKNAFVFSMQDIASSVERMSKKDQEALFNNGKNWANIEIIYPENKNVIDYDGGATIVFHGILQYNEAWTPSGEVKSGGARLAAIINKVNGAIKTKFAFKGPNVIELHKPKDYTKLKAKYIGSLSKLQNIYRLKDSDELSLWHQHFWLEYILNGANSTDYPNIPDHVLYPLMKRWAFSDKSYKMTEINKLKEDYPKFVDWVRSTEKLDHQGMLKKNMLPFEQIFFGVGAEILANASNYLSANPDKTTQKLRNELDSASKALMAKKDFSNIGKLKAQLAKLKSMPALSKVAPSEGLVFKYKGKVYKFTGFFAPINQILGLEKFSR